MKQYTTPEQTTKLIELGLPKPRYYSTDKYTIIHTGFDIINYSIGELIEMLPLSFNKDDYYALTIRGSKVMYCDPYLDWIESEWGKHEELIDNLFDACVELKEDKII